MVIAGKQRAVAKSVYPRGLESQEQWEEHARQFENRFQWLNEYGRTAGHQELIDEDLANEADYERKGYGCED